MYIIILQTLSEWYVMHRHNSERETPPAVFRAKRAIELKVVRDINLGPIYTAENFWYGSDKKGPGTQKIGTATLFTDTSYFLPC